MPDLHRSRPPRRRGRRPPGPDPAAGAGRGHEHRRGPRRPSGRPGCRPRRAAHRPRRPGVPAGAVLGPRRRGPRRGGPRAACGHPARPAPRPGAAAEHLGQHRGAPARAPEPRQPAQQRREHRRLPRPASRRLRAHLAPAALLLRPLGGAQPPVRRRRPRRDRPQRGRPVLLAARRDRRRHLAGRRPLHRRPAGERGPRPRARADAAPVHRRRGPARAGAGARLVGARAPRRVGPGRHVRRHGGHGTDGLVAAGAGREPSRQHRCRRARWVPAGGSAARGGARRRRARLHRPQRDARLRRDAGRPRPGPRRSRSCGPATWPARSTG